MAAGMKVRRLPKEVDVPGLGQKIKDARLSSGRSLSGLCVLVGISRNYWYRLEAENISGAVSEDILRKIEAVLSVDLGVKFEEDLGE